MLHWTLFTLGTLSLHTAWEDFPLSVSKIELAIKKKKKPTNNALKNLTVLTLTAATELQYINLAFIWLSRCHYKELFWLYSNPSLCQGVIYWIFSTKRTVVESEGFGSCWRLTKSLRILCKSTVQQTLHRPISTEGFKLLNRLKGWSTFTQISLLKTTTFFSSATGNIHVLLTRLMPQQFCSCKPPQSTSAQGAGLAALLGKQRTSAWALQSVGAANTSQ